MLPHKEQAHQDILQNIEAAIVGVYQQHSDLSDYQVDAALESLGRTYAGEARGKGPVLPRNPLALEVYQAVKSTCDWRLGRVNPVDEEGQPLNVEPVSMEIMLGLLKRLRKSVEYWNKESGTQGYLNYIRQFLS